MELLFSFSFDIEECKNCECDKLTYSTSYGRITFGSAKCVRRTSRHQEAIKKRDNRPEDFEIGREIWLRFVSDDTVFYKGFNLSYIASSETRKLIPFLSEKFQVVKYLNEHEAKKHTKIT